MNQLQERVMEFLKEKESIKEGLITFETDTHQLGIAVQNRESKNIPIAVTYGLNQSTYMQRVAQEKQKGYATVTLEVHKPVQNYEYRCVTSDTDFYFSAIYQPTGELLTVNISAQAKNLNTQQPAVDDQGYVTGRSFVPTADEFEEFLATAYKGPDGKELGPGHARAHMQVLRGRENALILISECVGKKAQFEYLFPLNEQSIEQKLETLLAQF